MSGVAAILLEPDVWLLLAGSVALATAVTMLATLLGVPLGVLLGRTDVGGRGWLLAVHAFPMFVPPFLVGPRLVSHRRCERLPGHPVHGSPVFRPRGSGRRAGADACPHHNELDGARAPERGSVLGGRREGRRRAGSRHRTDPAPHGVACRGARPASGLRSRSVRVGRAHVSARADLPSQCFRSAGRDRLRARRGSGSRPAAPGGDARAPRARAEARGPQDVCSARAASPQQKTVSPWPVEGAGYAGVRVRHHAVVGADTRSGCPGGTGGARRNAVVDPLEPVE